MTTTGTAGRLMTTVTPRGMADPSLVAHGHGALRGKALQILAAGLSAAAPRSGLARQVHLSGTTLEVTDRKYDLEQYEHVWLLGAGKATLSIAVEVCELLGDLLTGGLVVVQRGVGKPLPRVEVLEADHPIPSPSSYVAAQRLMEFAERIGPQDLLLAAFSGGSSALACLPAPGISFDAKQQLHQMLLASGADIEQINAVRKHASGLKAGRLARAASPAAIINLTIPDVPSGRLDCITDPTVPDESTVAEARQILRSRGLWDRVDRSIQSHLLDPSAESPDIGDLDIHSVLLSDGERACAAMRDAATALGLTPYVFGTRIEGESSTVGHMLATLATETARERRPFTPPCALIGAGGETVVTLLSLPPGATPVGGPNQETALAFASALRDSSLGVAAVFADSDGSDGGTPYAGAVVDSSTADRAAELGIDLVAALRAHESSDAFARLGDLVITGATLTNISDLWTVVIEPVVIESVAVETLEEHT